DHGLEPVGAGVVVGVRRVLGRRGAVEGEEVVAVVLGDGRLDLGVGDHHPVVGLHVGAGGGLDAAVDAPRDGVALDGPLEVQALADGPGRGEHLVGTQVQVHGG